MRFARVLLAAVPVVLAAGCGGGDSGPPLLLVATGAGLTVLDGTTGLFDAPAASAVTTPDGSLLVRAEPIGTRTEVRASDVAGTGDGWLAMVDGTMEPRAVAADGTRVALVSPATVPAGPDGGIAPGCERTEIAVVGEDGAVERYELEGNVEPEAFAVDATALFVIVYEPAEAPTSYQVRRLDLVTGELGDVYSVDAELQESMRGTARTQVWDPEGDRLYTLYQLESGAEVVTFVHVLDLDEQWAHCVDLPAGFTIGSAGMALAEGGDELYVADAASGAVVEVDTVDLAVARTGSIASSPNGTASVAVDDGAVFVAALTGITRVDRDTLTGERTFATTGPVVGLQQSRVGDELFVAWADRIGVLDPESGAVLRDWPIDTGVTGGVLSLGGSTVPGYSGVKCAC